MRKTSLDVDAGFRIRAARADEVELLQNIDLKSAELFLGEGLIDFGPEGVPVDPIPEDRIRLSLGEALVWVIAESSDYPVGFALASERGRDLYLDQVSVVPEFGRRGLGERLVRHVLEFAQTEGFERVSLSTFRDVPWNGPFYRRLGFKEIPSSRYANWQKELTEIQSQTMDVSKRCFMQRSVKRRFW